MKKIKHLIFLFYYTLTHWPFCCQWRSPFWLRCRSARLPNCMRTSGNVIVVVAMSAWRTFVVIYTCMDTASEIVTWRTLVPWHIKTSARILLREVILIRSKPLWINWLMKANAPWSFSGLCPFPPPVAASTAASLPALEMHHVSDKSDHTLVVE